MAAAAGMLLALLAPACGRETPRAPKDPALDRKMERLLALMVEVERSGASPDDSLALLANGLIEELGGQDSAASLLADRLIDNADRWVPLLDSLARVSSGAAISPAKN
jgi:hypothetical protein